MQNLFHSRTRVERETHRRIKLAIWAYAYEFEHVSLVPDAVFDAEARKVNTSVATTRPDLDFFFSTRFHPDTGMWIHDHPELAGIKRLYERHYDS